MATKSKSSLLLILWVVLLGCKSGPVNPFDPSRAVDPLPTNIWSMGSVQLAPNPRGFRLDGLCCAYMLIPQIKLDGQRRFEAKADYYSFNGAGYVAIPTTATGELSADGNILTLRYQIGSGLNTHRLQVGAATISALCGCL